VRGEKKRREGRKRREEERMERKERKSYDRESRGRNREEGEGKYTACQSSGWPPPMCPHRTKRPLANFCPKSHKVG
jgi:hypothetical protein